MATVSNEQIQQRLKELGHDLGTSGPNRDGVDGDIGPTTRARLLEALKTSKPVDDGAPAPIKPEPTIVYPASIPAAYGWLKSEGAPKMLVQALALHGTLEKPGATNNPVILTWAAETGLANVYKHDSIAWCGLFMAVVAKRAGYAPVKDPLWALNWRKFGKKVPKPMLGDVMVKSRQPSGGHVTMYVGEDATHYHCLGGNQSDQVNIVRYPKTGIDWTFHRPKFAVAQPANVRVVKVAAAGKPAGSEA